MIKKNYIFTLFLSVVFTIFYNNSFWSNTFEVFELSISNTPYLLSLFIIIVLFTNIVLTLVNTKYTLKPILIFLFIASSSAAYFMDSYGVIIDDNMLNNALATDSKEAADLINIEFLTHLFIFAVIPILILLKIDIKHYGFRENLFDKIKVIISSIIIITILLLSFGKYYTSFFREHKELRWYINPLYYIYSSNKLLNKRLEIMFPKEFVAYGSDAKIDSTIKKPKLVIIVVGEAARADHFSLNGYNKQTNPYMEKQDIINFTDVSSCGTETIISVPCMFSILSRSNYDEIDMLNSNNSLDILKLAGVNVLWRDNNSNPKGLMKRLGYDDFKNLKNDKYCKDGECRDELLLKEGLQSYIDKSTGDIVIVLHQMGSHGPAYYKRYPKKFEKFKPICESSKLENCTKEEISNTYDNTILYTDYFLDKTISFLKDNSQKYATAMLYMSDHGESLGENGIYLHGMPYMIAPKAQKHVGNIMWINDDLNINKECLKNKSNQSISHDNFYHSILGIMEIKTKDYDKDLDIFNSCR